MTLSVLSLRPRVDLLLLTLLLAACANKSKTTDSESSSLDQGPTRILENEVSSEDVEKNIERPYVSTFGEIQLEENVHVRKWINYFQGRGRGYMTQYLERSTRYLPMMKNVLRENGLPEELVYISLIESGFSPRAHSHANAVGYWQFIKSTGKRFGLKVDTFIDERRDPVLSTRAAAEYFKTLYSLLGSWHLAMAAYNVGENRVKRAVAKYYTRDFWELIKKRRAFPAETRNYVPKFIAAAIIAKDPKRYGFDEIEYQDPLSYDTVALQSPISLSKLSSNLSVDLEEMKLLNPKFRTDFVPISRGSETFVRIPVGRVSDALAALTLSVTNEPKIIQAEYSTYQIKRGDNLSTVAKRHRTTVSQLRRLNNLSNRTILRVGKRIKVPDNGGDGIQLVTEDGPVSNVTKQQRTLAYSESAELPLFHTVRSGENLTHIAKKYSLSIQEILRLNNLSNRSVIRKGQKLRIKELSPTGKYSASGQARSAKLISEVKPNRLYRKRVAGSQSMKYSKHTVKRGETLIDVSRKYGVSLSELAKVNQVEVSYRVMAGERLTIPRFK